MRQGMAALERTGTVLALPGLYLALAQLHLRIGDTREADRLLGVAAGEPGRGTRQWSAEIEKVRGELLEAGETPDLDSAEAAYRASLEIARQQKSRTIELRTSVAYARLLRRRRRLQEAIDLLVRSLEQMPEGGSMPDVRDAKAALESIRTGGNG